MKKKIKQYKKNDITIWSQDDPLEAVLKVVAGIILLCIIGFIVFAFVRI